MGDTLVVDDLMKDLDRLRETAEAEALQQNPNERILAQIKQEQRVNLRDFADQSTKLFLDSDFVRCRGVRVSENDLLLLDRFIAQVAITHNPNQFADFWDQFFVSREIVRRLIILLGNKVDGNKLLFSLGLFSLSRAFAPTFYGQEYQIINFLAEQMGIPPTNLVGYTLSIYNIYMTVIGAGNVLDPMGSKYTELQETAYDAFLEELSLNLQLMWFATILGEGCWTYEGRSTNPFVFDYSVNVSHTHLGFVMINKGRLLALESYILREIRAGLFGLGVDVKVLLEDLDRFRPRYVVVGRHGSVENPVLRELVVRDIPEGETEERVRLVRELMWYTRDSAMLPEHWVHLSKSGHAQYIEISKLLEDNGLICADVWVSPNIRAIESGLHVAERFGVELKIEPLIDEAMGHNFYKKGMHITTYPLDRLQFSPFWTERGHECVLEIMQRMRLGFLKALSSLEPGKARMLVSHGDPATLLAHMIFFDYRPAWFAVYERVMINKGDALVFVCPGEDQVFAAFALNGRPVRFN